MWCVIVPLITFLLICWLPDFLLFVGQMVRAVRERRRGRTRTDPGGPSVDR